MPRTPEPIEIEVEYDDSPVAAVRWRAGLQVLMDLMNQRDAAEQAQRNHDSTAEAVAA